MPPIPSQGGGLPAGSRLSAHHAKGIVDVTAGDTADPSEGSTGFPATVGYDQATGVGTIDAARFVTDLLLRHP